MIENESTGNGFYMPVAPAYNGNAGGFGDFGGGGWWILLLFILLGNGGWGGNGGFGGGGLYPWMNQAEITTNGFQNSMLNDGVTSIRDGVTGLSAQLCSCCSDMQMALANTQSSITQQMYSNELASLNRSFAEQTANTAGFNGVQSSLCDIRYGNATNTRDIIESQTRGTQAILDKLCALEIDNYKRENDQLRTQLNMANLAASQTAQTAEIRTSQATVANQLVNELRSCPIPSQPVYGNTPIFSCNSGCGCSGSTGTF